MAERMRYKEIFYNRLGRSGLKVSEIGQQHRKTKAQIALAYL